MNTKANEPDRNSDDARRGFLARIRRAFGLNAPSREEIRRRIRSKPGIIGITHSGGAGVPPQL
jgi:hypothetical protein